MNFYSWTFDEKKKIFPVEINIIGDWIYIVKESNIYIYPLVSQ